MSRKDEIMDIYQELLIQGLAKDISIADIARKANIAKGGLYYYFKDKEELLDSVIERYFHSIIEKARSAVEQHGGSAKQKIQLLFEVYVSSQIDEAITKTLHDPHNAYIHQKSQIYILQELASILTSIIEAGAKKGELVCEKSRETAEITLISVIFLLDPGLFQWNPEEFQSRLGLIIAQFERAIGIEMGTLTLQF